MGQYWRAAIGNDKVQAGIDGYVDNEYVMAKLTEHGWWDNQYANNVAYMIYNAPQRVAWIGDYADSEEFYNTTPNGEITLASKTSSAEKPLLSKVVWNDDTPKITGLVSIEFNLENKYLINHDTKEFLDCSKYAENSKGTWGILHPLTLLTAVGNGMGGGDFNGKTREMEDNVGIWAWNLLEIKDTKPLGYNEVEYTFIEEC